MALTELDKQTGFIEKAVGKDAAPWVRVGLGVAAMVLTGAAAMSGTGAEPGFASAIKMVQGATTMVEGAGAVFHGVRTIIDANDRADEIDRQADIQATLNRMQQLNRMVDDLLELLGTKNDDNKTTQELGSDLVQTQTAMNSATLMPA
jgi:hypothetical protein